MNKIIPAILEKTPEAFAKTRDALLPFSERLHIDLADGRFVPNETLSIHDLKTVEPAVPYDLHLMYERPERILNELTQLSPARIIIHAEATHNVLPVVRAIQNAGKTVIIALNPETPVSVLKPIIAECDAVLLMAVHPGFQGGAFIPAIRGKIQAFRAVFPSTPLMIDGAMDENTLPMLSLLDVNYFIVGSAIAHAENPAAAFARLTSMTKTV